MSVSAFFSGSGQATSFLKADYAFRFTQSDATVAAAMLFDVAVVNEGDTIEKGTGTEAQAYCCFGWLSDKNLCLMQRLYFVKDSND